MSRDLERVRTRVDPAVNELGYGGRRVCDVLAVLIRICRVMTFTVESKEGDDSFKIDHVHT